VAPLGRDLDGIADSGYLRDLAVEFGNMFKRELLDGAARSPVVAIEFR
jgi:hypothetical protein